MEGRMRNFVETRDWRSRDAVMGTVLACLSVAHQNIQAAEIPNGANWEDIRLSMLSTQRDRREEQVAQLLIGADPNKDIMSLPIQTGENQVYGVNDLVLRDRMEGLEGFPGERACIVHTHPRTPRYLYDTSIAFDVVARPSGYDLGVAKRHRQFTIQEKTLPMEHAVFLADGSIWYYEYNGTGNDSNYHQNDEQITQELVDTVALYMVSVDRRKNDVTMMVMNFLGQLYQKYHFSQRFVPSMFVNSEPPCAGADYPVEYSYDPDTHEWKIKKTK